MDEDGSSPGSSETFMEAVHRISKLLEAIVQLLKAIAQHLEAKQN